MEDLDSRLRSRGYIPHKVIDARNIAEALALEGVHFSNYERICIIPPGLELRENARSINYIIYVKPTKEYKERIDKAPKLLTCLVEDPETKDLTCIRL